MLNIILIALPVIIVLFVIIVATRPAEFQLARSITISAPPAVVFPNVNELKKWAAWSPWAKLDPNAKYTFEGPPAGVGASMAWVGNNKVGEGKMTITESRSNELVGFKLEFLKPMAATSTAEFTFKSQGSQTVVTWAMMGRNNFVAKAFHLLLNCGKMIGCQFDLGLASLKAIAEASGK